MAGEYVFEGAELNVFGFLAQQCRYHRRTVVTVEELAEEFQILRLPPAGPADIAGLIRKGLILEVTPGRLSVTDAGMRFAKESHIID